MKVTDWGGRMRRKRFNNADAAKFRDVTNENLPPGNTYMPPNRKTMRQSSEKN